MADQEIENAVTRALEDAPLRNFRETVDLAINLRDIDLDDPSNRVDQDVVLPSGTGQETQIVVFAEGETALRAEDVADEVLDDDALEELGDDDDEAKDLADETDFFVAEADIMQDVASFSSDARSERSSSDRTSSATSSARRAVSPSAMTTIRVS